MTRWFLVGVFVAFGILGLISCQPPAATDATAAAPSPVFKGAERPGAGGPVRDLSLDEVAGGHILRKHVGQTEEELRQRLRRENGITGASTYTDRLNAEQAVGAAIENSRSQIQDWLSQPGRRHPNLVLDYDSEAPIGRTMNRGEVHSHICQHAVVVLKYSGPERYYVLTSYPECR